MNTKEATNKMWGKKKPKKTHQTIQAPTEKKKKLHTDLLWKRNPLECEGQGSEVIRITVEDKSTKKMSLTYNKSWAFLSNSKDLITGRDINE